MPAAKGELKGFNLSLQAFLLNNSVELIVKLFGGFRHIIEEITEKGLGKMVGMGIVFHSSCDIRSSLGIILDFTLVLVQEGDYFDERKEAFMISACAHPDRGEF
jgi:hypothetical protein